uniref:Uncharacterized protein n=1 Tax=Aegilops tauschii TaxID=37682 RepID=M8BN86_AEGTA
MAQGKKRGREEEQEAGAGRVVEGKAEVAVAEEGGFLSSMASKIGVAMSGATNGSGGAEDTGEGNGNGNGSALAVSDGDEEKAAGNGIFHKLLSSSSPSPPVTVFRGTEEERRGGKDEDEGGEQAGILSAMASKIGMAMSGNGTHGGSGEDVDHSKGEGEDKEEMGGDEPNGGGIVKQIMSNLPTSDTRGPDAEEASLLISIIDD